MRMFKRGEEADEESIIEPEDENIHGLDKRDPWKMRMFKKEQPWKMRMFKRYPYYDKKSPWKMRMFKRMSTGFGNATYFQRIIFLVSLLASIRNFDWDYLYTQFLNNSRKETRQVADENVQKGSGGQSINHDSKMCWKFIQ